MTLSEEEKQRIIDEERFRLEAKEIAQKQINESNNKKSRKGCLIIILICLIVGSCEKACSSLDKKYSPPPPRGIQHCDETGAYIVAKKFITTALKSPKSAEFPNKSEVNIKKIEDGCTYQVQTYVDAQNSFGALIREKFTVVVSNYGSENWSLIDIKPGYVNYAPTKIEKKAKTKN